MLNRIWFILLSLSSVISACKSTIRTEKELYKWINDKDNGLVQEKTTNGFTLTAKYLPAELLAYREYESDKTIPFNKVLENYKKNKTFLMSIKVDTATRHTGNILFQDAEGYAGYKQRILSFNFGLEEMISLNYSEKKYKPVLYTLENTFNVVDGKNVYLVFNIDSLKKQNKQDEMDLVFEDVHFSTGITHFQFKVTDLQNIPKIELSK